MKRNSKLSGVLHVLLHMAEKDTPVTSQVLSGAMQTNPVVIRRMLAGLREKGLVKSEKGHGGGWTLACKLESITLYDVYLAIGEPGLFALGNRTESPGCLIEKAVNNALDRTFHEAEQLLLNRFKQVTLDSLSNEFHQKMNDIQTV